MKKYAIAVFALASLPVPAAAREVIGVFDNLGQCNSAWNAMVNGDRKEMRPHYEGPGQSHAWQYEGFYCAKSNGLWLLVKA